MKKTLLGILILTNLFLTACWDMVEINDRKFPYSVGIDLNGEEDGKFNITFSAPNINAIGKGGTQDKRLRISSVGGDSIFTAEKKIFKKVQNPIYTKHLKVLVLSEGVAKNKEDIEGIVDGFNRDFQINKSVRMSLVKDSAEDFIHKIPTAESQEEIEGTLYKLLTNNQRSSAFTSKTVMEFINDHDNKKSSVIPVGRIEKNEYIFEGGGVFKEYELVGYIDSEINKGLGLLLNTIKEDEINIVYEGVNLSIHIMNVKLKRKLKDREELTMEYSIEVECHIQEYTIDDDKDIDSEKIIEEIQNEINKKLKGLMDKAIEKFQKDLRVDYIGVCEYLQKFHPKIWKEVGDDWDTLFPTIDIQLRVDSKIRRRGLTK